MRRKTCHYLEAPGQQSVAISSENVPVMFSLSERAVYCSQREENMWKPGKYKPTTSKTAFIGFKDLEEVQEHFEIKI